ncbi:MAG: DUF349 domain-containing protein [Flavobacteriaceae bacterium]
MITLDNLQDADGTLEEQKNNISEDKPSQEEVENDEKTPESTQETTEVQDEEVESEKTEKINEEKDFNYENLSLESLISEFEQLLKNDDIYSIRPKINTLKKVFNQKFSIILNEKKEAFLAEGGNSIDFSFDSSLKKQFNGLSKIFREKNEKFEKKKTENLQQNLESRLQIIEEIKGLIDISQSSNATYNKFKNLQEQWRSIGKVPVKNANDVWNNYRHHVEKFYDFLHLNRDLRERDYKYNLEKKQKLIKSVEALANEENLGRAFRELQAIHKIWKEELGPVSKEYREVLWEQFSAATKVINDKRQEYNAHIEQELMANFDSKKVIIEKIKSLTETENSSHGKWQKRMKEVEELRENFFKIGSVPKKLRNQSWTDFKSALRTFNKTKNNFYKDLKKSHSDNLKKKIELVEIAVQNKDSEDFETTAALMRTIQNQWKKIGHISKKDSNKLWKEFRGACNHFFDRYHEHKNAGTPEEIENLAQKEQLLKEVKSFEIGDNKEDNLKAIKDFSKQWNALGRVPKNKRHIDHDFFKTMSKLFVKTGVNEEELISLKYTNKIQELSKDPKALNNEISFVRKKIDEIKSEMNQLENNLQFFSNVADDNPMVIDVQKKIEKHKDQLQQWTKKLSNIKKVID